MIYKIIITKKILERKNNYKICYNLNMKSYKTASIFKSLPIEIFYYSAKQKTRHTVILLKGLYGLHDSKSNTSWDNEVIKSLKGKYNFICINTARRETGGKEKHNQKSFTGKTFKQECDDVYKAYQYLIDQKVISKEQKLSIMANSFGGTTLLGIPQLIRKSSSIIMVGSGCGKSLTTTKPLLKTLFNEDILLKAISSYKGIFAYIRGEKDTIVPKESQEKIIQAFKSASIKVVYEIRGAQHNLTSVTKTNSINRQEILTSILENTLALI